MASTSPVTAGYNLRKLSSAEKDAVFDATVANRNVKRIQSAAFSKLRKSKVVNPKRVFQAYLRFLCPMTMPAERTNDAGETVDTEPPAHSHEVFLEDGSLGYRWTKWLTNPDAKEWQVHKSEVLEIVLPATQGDADHAESEGCESNSQSDDTSAIMAALKDVVAKTFVFALRGTGKPLVPTDFVPVDPDAPVQTQTALGPDGKTVDMWYNTALNGFMIASSGKDGSMAVMRVKRRLEVQLQAPNQSQKKNKKKKNKTEAQRVRA